ncbi:hypothetical protein, partial [Salegentibacter maritimus]|uniref:hypothetical protein n=1 Tax=Salegentibacter maritimus TaxID=2794347 RepID=UPI001E5CD56B
LINLQEGLSLAGIGQSLYSLDNIYLQRKLFFNLDPTFEIDPMLAILFCFGIFSQLIFKCHQNDKGKKALNRA